MTKTLFGLPVRDIEHRDTLIEKFKKYVEVTESGCWEWRAAATPGGYGNLYIDGIPSPHAAHRKSYELFVDEIPEGLLICHRCDNPKCIRPNHLFVGTQKDNQIDSANKGRKHTQLHGHSDIAKRKIGDASKAMWADNEFKKSRVGKMHHFYGKSHSEASRKIMGTKSKTAARTRLEFAKAEQTGVCGGVSIAEARKILEDTRSQRLIAKEYGVSQPYISDIKNRKTWHFRDD